MPPVLPKTQEKKREEGEFQEVGGLPISVERARPRFARRVTDLSEETSSRACNPKRGLIENGV
jgi:hypothetical protein